MGKNKVKAVVIDDDKYTVQAIKKSLKDLNLLDQIDSFIDPIHALENIKANKYELIITDNSMPEIDGIELAERVLKIYKPVIVLVSVVCNQVRTKFNGDEIFDYIYQKPLDYETFTDEMAEIIKEIVQAKAIKKMNEKNGQYVDQIVSKLSQEEDEYIYNKLSKKNSENESEVRSRLSDVSESGKPIDFILRMVRKRLDRNKEASK